MFSNQSRLGNVSNNISHSSCDRLIVILLDPGKFKPAVRANVCLMSNKILIRLLNLMLNKI